MPKIKRLHVTISLVFKIKIKENKMAEPKWLKDMDASEYLKEDFDAKGESWIQQQMLLKTRNKLNINKQ